MLLLELVGGQVMEAAVWSDGVVMDAPVLNEDGRLAPRAEPLDTQAHSLEAPFETRAGKTGLRGTPFRHRDVRLRSR